MKKVLKAKSLVSHKTDQQIEHGGGTVRFMSFEGAIQMFREYYKLMELKEQPDGYRITERGIEMVQL